MRTYPATVAAAVLLVATGCQVARPPSVTANRVHPERWHLLALPRADGKESMLGDLLVAHGDIWLAEGDAVTRIDPDGTRTPVAQLAPMRLLAQPTGIAVVTRVDDRASGVRITRIDRDGAVLGRPSDAIDLWPATLSPLTAVARPSGNVVLYGQRGYGGPDPHLQNETCVVAEVDGNGAILYRTELVASGIPGAPLPTRGRGGYGCRPAGVAVVDADVIVGMTIDSGIPALGMTANPVEPPIGVIARLGPDGTVKWRRELPVDHAGVELADLAIVDGAIAAVGIIEQDWGERGYEIGFAPTPRTVNGAEYPGEPRGRVFALGLDATTGHSRWLRLFEARGELAFLVYGLWAAAADDLFAIAIQPMNTGEIHGEPMALADVHIAALDGATGAIRWTRRAKADQAGDGWRGEGILVSRLVASPGGAVHLVGGFRRRLAIGSAMIRHPTYDGRHDNDPGTDPYTAFVARVTR